MRWAVSTARAAILIRRRRDEADAEGTKPLILVVDRFDLQCQMLGAYVAGLELQLDTLRRHIFDQLYMMMRRRFRRLRYPRGGDVQLRTLKPDDHFDEDACPHPATDELEAEQVAIAR